MIALIAATGALGQWRNYLLFTNGGSFDATDPQFHKNVGFFVFKLPFLSFIVSWAFVTLVVVAVFTVIAHYLNGGIRVQSGTPSVAPQVKVHLSVLLACMALVKAVGYVLARYNLDLSQNGYVQGAGYTDVHARLPALDAAHLDLAAGRGDPAHQHPPPGLGAARPRGGAVGLRGRRRGCDLPGHRPGRQGDTRPRTRSSSPTSPATSTPPATPSASTTSSRSTFKGTQTLTAVPGGRPTRPRSTTCSCGTRP